MRALPLVLVVVAALVVPAVAAQEDFGSVGKVSNLVDIRETPELAPGDRGRFSFVFNSTYTEAIQNVRLNATIYRYATIDETIAVDSAWPYAYPRIEETGTREWIWTLASVGPRTAIPLNFTVVTAAESRDMPHGSVFSQSSYFVRFWVEFDGIVNANVTRLRMASRGFFSNAQWAQATSANITSPCRAPSCRGNVNLTLLGVDGILPDSAFGVKEPIPRWPFYALIGAAALFLALAFLFWVEENPGAYPRVEAGWARTRGRLARAVASLRRRKQPES